jgi:hypothetical protein
MHAARSIRGTKNLVKQALVEINVNRYQRLGFHPPDASRTLFRSWLPSK